MVSKPNKVILSDGFCAQKFKPSSIDRNSVFTSHFSGIPIGLKLNQQGQCTLGKGKDLILVNPNQISLFHCLWYSGEGKGKIGGPKNVNTQMVAMLLNAANHGLNGIHYPILSQFGGPYANLQTFAQFLYQSALIDPQGVGQTLSDTIDSFHA
ncbi:hypothetical protein HR060_03690 [Catenovulum sp. SM1970]|uniref:hypothetical protein n=1 Tax=Marinifaba aquimaris TaxID=2741323 RepID=UPI001573BEFD|nr:hypothetical protein [Marinifaba aquimaris]NTS75962.1 hypothetical protein [Marinifaba aquimaris]